jgi:hypothetical protein
LFGLTATAHLENFVVSLLRFRYVYALLIGRALYQSFFLFFLPEGGTVLCPGVGLLGQPAPERAVFVSGPVLCEDDNQLAAGDAEKCKVSV